MSNFPGPYEVRLLYTTNNGAADIDHQMRFSMDMDTPAGPGDPFSDWTCLSRFGAAPQLDTWVDNLILKLKVVYNASSSFVSAELWKYAPLSYDAAFQSAYPIGVAGTNVGATVPDAQSIITFRSQLGGSARLNLMEAVYGGSPTQSYPFSIALLNDVADFITDVQSPVVARDGGYLFSTLHLLLGLNEALFKKRMRP